MVITFQVMIHSHHLSKFFLQLLKSPHPFFINYRSVNIDRYFVWDLNWDLDFSLDYPLNRIIYIDWFIKINWFINIYWLIDIDNFFDYFWNKLLIRNFFLNLYNFLYNPFRSLYIFRNFHPYLNWFLYNNLLNCLFGNFSILRL